jgi:hypothetical protein
MPLRLVRQIFSVLLMIAYVSATILTVAPAAPAASHEMAGGMAMKADGTSDEMPMPCSKGMKTSCVTELGCIFMMSLPAAHTAMATMISWSPVIYTITAQFPPENSLKPALGPPRSRA